MNRNIEDLVILLEGQAAMVSTQQRHDDIVIRRRFGENASTSAVKHVYAVTYPDHTDHGPERESHGKAEQMALTLAEEKGLSVWYEEHPHTGRSTLVKSVRGSNETTTQSFRVLLRGLAARAGVLIAAATSSGVLKTESSDLKNSRLSA